MNLQEAIKVAELEDRVERLSRFFRWVMWAGGDWCNDVDGADLQEQAESLELIEWVTRDEPCCERCACAEVYGEDEFPVQCYKYAQWLEVDHA